MENLCKNPLFQGTNPQEIEQMLICFQSKRKTFQEKEIICTYEADTDTLGLLLEGSISVNRIHVDGTQDMLEYIEGTGIFGASLIFSTHEDAFTVVCEKKCTVLFIQKHHITKRCKNACLHHTTVVQNLMQIMAEKVVSLTEKVDILSHRSIRGKLLSYFQIQSAKNTSSQFVMPFSLVALANYLCIDRSAMMRELKKMKEEGLVEINGKQVRLLQSPL